MKAVDAASSSNPPKAAPGSYSPTTGWSEPVVLAQGDIRGEPRVATDAAGNAVVAFVEQAEFESQPDAYAVLHSGGQWEEPVRLGVDEFTGAAFQPSVAMDANGKAVVVWREGPDIWASVFE